MPMALRIQIAKLNLILSIPTENKCSPNFPLYYGIIVMLAIFIKLNLFARKCGLRSHWKQSQML